MKKIIIFFHIYYIDLLDDYLWYLNNIKNTKYDYDLYVSICREIWTSDVNNKLTDFNKNVIITQCDNRGADMGGFFATLRKNTINFNLYNSVLYLHTKNGKSYGKEISYTWRGQLLNDILINSELIEFCIDKLQDNGIIGSSRCIIDIEKSLNIHTIERMHFNTLCNILNIPHQKNSNFVVGTIFWSNPKIFKIIQDSTITQDNFEKPFEHYNLLEHGFERIFGNISQYLKLNVIGIQLDINNEIYSRSYLFFKNYKIPVIPTLFKINQEIILPYENNLKEIILYIKKFKRINNKYI